MSQTRVGPQGRTRVEIFRITEAFDIVTDASASKAGV